jgi:hypothetical protein
MLRMSIFYMSITIVNQTSGLTTCLFQMFLSIQNTHFSLIVVLIQVTGVIHLGDECIVLVCMAMSVN